MSSPLHILVSGAGIAGPAVCYWLKKFGFNPSLIEKAPAIRRGGQPLDLRGVTTALARKMGIYDKVCAQRTTIACGRFVDTQGNVIHEVQGEQFGFRQDDEVEIVRGNLVRILMDLIPDVPCHFNRTIAGLTQDNAGVTVQYHDGATEHYDLVIGCDGIYSAIRRMAFQQSEYELVNLGSYLCTYTIPNYLQLDHTEIACEAKHKLLTITSDHDALTACAGFMFRSDVVLNDTRDEQEQKQLLQQTFNDFGWEAKKVLALMDDTHDFYFDGITQVKMQEWTKNRIALVGDAGYCASPLSGQGNNLALVGAYILAGELKAAHGNHKIAFARYNMLMRDFVKSNQAFGVWVSQSYLVENLANKDEAEERTQKILAMLKTVSHGIQLKDYV